MQAGLDLDNDNSDVEEADLNLNLDESNRVFDEDDHEVEEEDDAWFDQMIASSLSTDVVEDSQPLEPPPLGVQAAIAETQLDLPDLFNDSQVPDAFPKSPAADVRGRPVARPLAVIDLESPVVKEEVHANHCTPVAAVESAEVKSKRDYVAFLRKQLQELEVALGNVELGAHLFKSIAQGNTSSTQRKKKAQWVSDNTLNICQ